MYINIMTSKEMIICANWVSLKILNQLELYSTEPAKSKTNKTPFTRKHLRKSMYDKQFFQPILLIYDSKIYVFTNVFLLRFILELLVCSESSKIIIK